MREEKTIKDLMREVVEREADKLGPDGLPITGGEIDNFAESWTEILETEASKAGYQIILERIER